MVKMRFNDDIRFGTNVKDKANSEVTTYFLSQEELEKYQSQDTISKRHEAKMCAEAKRLLFETDSRIVDIIKKTGVPRSTLEFWLRQHKNGGLH